MSADPRPQEEEAGPPAGTCCMTCGRVYDNQWPDVPLDTSVRAAGWGRLDFPAGVRYVCRECRKPQPAQQVESAQGSDQLDLFASSP